MHKPSKTLSMPVMLALVLTAALLLASGLPAKAQGQLLQGWQLEEHGGYYAESDGTIRLWSDTPNAYGGPSLYKEISPQGDFEFSAQVKAATLGNWNEDVNKEGFSITLAPSLPFFNNTRCVNFEFRGRDNGTFLVARYTYYWASNPVLSNNPDYPRFPSQTYPTNAVQTEVWYTMKLKVQKSPFTVTAKVEAENGTVLGSFSVFDMTKITFHDIRYIGLLSSWGGDFSIKNIAPPHSDLQPSTSPSSAITLSPSPFDPTNVTNISSPSVPTVNESAGDFGEGNSSQMPEPAILSSSANAPLSSHYSTWLAVAAATATIVLVPIILRVAFSKKNRAFCKSYLKPEVPHCAKPLLVAIEMFLP